MENKKIIGNPVSVPNPKVDVYTKDKIDAKVQNLEKYGTANVYILQDSVDYISEDGLVIEMLKWDYSGKTIAFPEGITEVNANGPIDSEQKWLPLTCHKLIFPKSLEKFNIYSIAIDDIDTNCVEEIILYADSHDSNSNAKQPQKICFNNTIRKISCYSGNTEISFSSPIVDEVDITSQISSNYGEHISFDLRNTHNVKLNLEDSYADEFNPPSFKIYGYEGTYAEEYAKDKNIEFINMGSKGSGGGADMETIKQYVDEQIGEALEGDY